ncbi:MAG: GNAT family N-acetyltransferase, partial [Woeseia sp.]
GYDFVFVDSDITAGELLGYACFGPIPLREAAYDLYWIAVAPGRQQQGLGRRLLLHAEERAAEQGAVEMYIDTSGRAQYVPTRRFYERAGYTTHEVLPDFYATGDDKVVYRKHLDRGRAI